MRTSPAILFGHAGYGPALAGDAVGARPDSAKASKKPLWLGPTGRDGAAAVAVVAASTESIRRGGAVELEPPAERRAWPGEKRA